AVAGPLEVAGLLLDADVGGHPAVSLDPAVGEASQHQQHQQHRQRPPQEAAAPRSPATPAAAGLLRLALRLGDLVERDVLVVHPASSWVGSGAGAGSPRSPVRAPVDRAVPRSCWTLIAAGT